MPRETFEEEVDRLQKEWEESFDYVVLNPDVPYTHKCIVEHRDDPNMVFQVVVGFKADVGLSTERWVLVLAKLDGTYAGTADASIYQMKIDD